MSMAYRIGSFNMRKFGAYPSRDFNKIADIIRGEELDVVAFQEIFSEGKGLSRLLEGYVRREFYNWGFCWASPKESNDISKMGEQIVSGSRGEGYAYIWNTRKFKLAESGPIEARKLFEPRIINSFSNDVNVDCRTFARAPYYIRLFPCHGGQWELRLVNIHIYYGDTTLPSVQKRQDEFSKLVEEIYPQINQRVYGSHRSAYTIAMGDYNLNIFRPGTNVQSKAYLKEVHNYNDGRKNYQVLTIQDQLTTLRGGSSGAAANNLTGNYANNYDHFTYSPELSPFSDISYYAIDAVNKYCGGDFEYYNSNISDHLPIVMEIKV